MATSIQETLRAVLGADADLVALVADRIYPGQLPDDEDPTPWLFYKVPSSKPIDQLDDWPVTVTSELELHALADTYAQAKAVIDATVKAIEAYRGGIITRVLWDESTEDETEEGYHHATRFRVWWLLSPDPPPAP